MTDIDELDEKFSIEGELGFAELENDLIFMTVSNKYANADICLYGAHIMSFVPYNSMDILWMSPDSLFETGKPIRGGIPVCFPWFGQHKTDQDKPMHGFGRLMNWDVVETAAKTNGETFIRLQLCSSEETKPYWPYNFCAEISINVGLNLEVTLKIINNSGETFDYSCALHSYFNLSAIDNIRIIGLEGAGYINQLEPGDFVQEGPFLEINKAETRHYYNTEEPCIIEDNIFKRRILMAKSGSKITTVWNPWEETCTKIEDLPNNSYQSFVCVETVNAFNDTITLAPGESHETSTIIGLV